MKRNLTSLLACILLATSLPALAGHDHYRHGGNGGWGRAQFERHRDRPAHHHNHGLAWGVAGLALGGVILSMTTPRPPPVVVAPVVMTPPPQPPERYWYYCESYRAYYPTTKYCPEGWRAISAY